MKPNRRHQGAPRWPVAPLRSRFPTAHALAEACGMSGSTLTRIVQTHGLLTTTQADRASVQLGLHPSELWPDWAQLDPDEAFPLIDLWNDLVAENDGDELFVRQVWPTIVRYVTDGTAALEQSHGTRRQAS